jgi:hypothetical protein
MDGFSKKKNKSVFFLSPRSYHIKAVNAIMGIGLKGAGGGEDGALEIALQG